MDLEQVLANLDTFARMLAEQQTQLANDIHEFRVQSESKQKLLRSGNTNLMEAANLRITTLENQLRLEEMNNNLLTSRSKSYQEEINTLRATLAKKDEEIRFLKALVESKP